MLRLKLAQSIKMPNRPSGIFLVNGNSDTAVKGQPSQVGLSFIRGNLATIPAEIDQLVSADRRLCFMRIQTAVTDPEEPLKNLKSPAA